MIFDLFMRKPELEYWQMREALGYPVPSWADKKWPRQFGGNGGVNPYVCGFCEARRRNPDLHVTKHFEVRVAVGDDTTAAKYQAAGFEQIGWDSAPKDMQPHPGFNVWRST